VLADALLGIPKGFTKVSDFVERPDSVRSQMSMTSRRGCKDGNTPAESLTLFLALVWRRSDWILEDTRIGHWGRKFQDAR